MASTAALSLSTVRHGRWPPRRSSRTGPRHLARITGRGHAKDARRAGHPGPRRTVRRIGRTLSSCQCVRNTSSMTQALATPRKYRGRHHATGAWMNLRDAGGVPPTQERSSSVRNFSENEGSRGVPNTNQGGSRCDDEGCGPVKRQVHSASRLRRTAGAGRHNQGFLSRATGHVGRLRTAVSPSRGLRLDDLWTFLRSVAVGRWWRRASSTPLSRSFVVPERRFGNRAT